MSNALRSYEEVIQSQYASLGEYEDMQREHQTNVMKLESEIQTTRLKDYVQSRTIYDQIVRDLIVGKQRYKETLGMIRSEIKLDLSLERGRQKDIQSGVNMKIQNLSSKFESEAANCFSTIQKIRQETMYTIIGYLFTSVAAFLGFFRLMKNK